MEGILDWGLGLVRQVQVIASPTLTVAMKGVSFLGSEWFYLAALPLIYWCFDRRRGMRLTVVFLFSSFLNLWLKDTLGQPRPYWRDPAVGMAVETSYGLPSGHAQGTLVFWGAAAPLFKRYWGLALAIVLPLAVGFSRVYLGVHFPTDVFVGWALGGLLLAADHGFGDRIERALSRVNLRLKVAGVALLALGMNALTMHDTSMSGVFFGASAGFLFVKKLVPFKAAAGGLGRKVLRCLVGFAGAALIYLGLKVLFPGEGSELYALFRFLRYGLLGAWVSLGAPWIFAKLKLVELE